MKKFTLLFLATLTMAHGSSEVEIPASDDESGASAAASVASRWVPQAPFRVYVGRRVPQQISGLFRYWADKSQAKPHKYHLGVNASQTMATLSIFQ